MLAGFKKSWPLILLAAIVLSCGLLDLPLICRGQIVLAPPGRHVARESIEWIRIWLPNVMRPQLSHKVVGQYGKGKSWDLLSRPDIGWRSSRVNLRSSGCVNVSSSGIV